MRKRILALALGAERTRKQSILISLLILALLTPVAWFYGFFNADWSYILGFTDAPELPVAEPINISKKGSKANFFVRVEDKKSKIFVDLHYDKYKQTRLDNETYDRLVKKYLCTDYFERIYPPFPVKITVKAIKNTNITLIDNIVNPSRPARVVFDRTIFYEKLSPGIYEIKVETIKNYPELKDLNAWIYVNYDFAK